MKWQIWLPLLVACGGAREEPQTVTVSPVPAATTATVATAAPAMTHVPEPEPLPVATQSAQASGGNIVDRDAWMASFETALPVALCKPTFYFRSCFTVTALECEQTAASATRVCLSKFKKQLPREIHQPDEGTAWGSKIGSCTGIAYEAALSTHRISNPKCDDPSQWTTPP